MTTTFLNVANGAVSTTAGAIDNSTDPVTFSVAAGQGALFPSAFPFHITIGNEILSCTARSTDSLTCARAQQSTTIASHASGAAVELRVTAKSLSDLNTAVNTVEGKFPVASADIADGTIVNADVNASAAIDATKINTGAVTNTEFNYLDGVTSAVQTQLDASALLAGRSGGQTLIGGTGSGDPLTLKATSSAAAGANLVLDASVHQGNSIVPQFATTLTAAQTMFSIASGQTIAINASGGMRGYNVSGTWNVNAAPNASCFIGTNFNPTVHLTATGAALKATNCINVSGTYDISANVSLATDAGPFNGLKVAPNFADGGVGGTQTITAMAGVDTVPTIATGWTVTTYRGLRVQKPAGTGTITTIAGVDVADLAARAGSNYAIRTNGLNDQVAFGGMVGIGTAPSILANDGSVPTISVSRALTITGGVTDGYIGGLGLSPTYDAATALTVTRHNYIFLGQPTLTGTGPAAVTDACVFTLNAALGTHKATTNTDRTGNAKSGTLKVNVNGTLYYIQLYA